MIKENYKAYKKNKKLETRIIKLNIYLCIKHNYELLNY